MNLTPSARYVGHFQVGPTKNYAIRTITLSCPQA